MTLPRREFLRTGALATGAAVTLPLPSWLPWARPLPPDPARPGLTRRRPGDLSERVIVLGAGLAGLAAARELTRAGYDVTVIEARDRPGGRVHTMREPFSDDLYAEAGAMFAGGPTMVRFAEELGIEFVSPGTGSGGTGDFQYVVGGERVRITPGGADSGTPAPDWRLDLTDAEREMGLRGMWGRYMMAAVEDVGNPLEDGWPPEGLRRLDDMSFADYLAGNGASPAAIELLRLDVLDMYGQGIESMSALAFLRDWAARRFMGAGGPGGVIPGGTDRIPEALAAELSGRIRYGVEAVRIEQGDASASVVVRPAGSGPGGSTETLTADRVVCTLPFSVLRHIDIHPALPADKRRAIAELPYSTITRVYVEVDDRFWEERGLNGGGWIQAPAPRILVHPMGRRTTGAVLEAHAGKAAGLRLAELSEDQRLAAVRDQLEEFHPGLGVHARGGASYAWSEDPWTRGGYSSFAPGQVFDFLPVIARPEGRIHFAGEHTSRLSASMDGALESGVRAAAEIDAAAVGATGAVGAEAVESP